MPRRHRVTSAKRTELELLGLRPTPIRPRRICAGCDREIPRLWHGYPLCQHCIDITPRLERPGWIFHRVVGDRIVRRLKLSHSP